MRKYIKSPSCLCRGPQLCSKPGATRRAASASSRSSFTSQPQLLMNFVVCRHILSMINIDGVDACAQKSDSGGSFSLPFPPMS